MDSDNVMFSLDIRSNSGLSMRGGRQTIVRPVTTTNFRTKT